MPGVEGLNAREEERRQARELERFMEMSPDEAEAMERLNEHAADTQFELSPGSLGEKLLPIIVWEETILRRRDDAMSRRERVFTLMDEGPAADYAKDAASVNAEIAVYDAALANGMLHYWAKRIVHDWCLKRIQRSAPTRIPDDPLHSSEEA